MDQRSPQATLLRASGETGIVVLWEDWRSSTGDDDEAFMNLYCQRIDDHPVNSAGDEAAVVPVDFKITGIYPNPFNSRVRLDYSLSAQAAVNLMIFDVTGRVTLQQEFKSLDAGSHSLSLDAGRWSSGIYLVRLRADDASITKRLVCIK